MCVLQNNHHINYHKNINNHNNKPFNNCISYQKPPQHQPSQTGVGSGVVLRLLNHQLDFVLITLYTAPKHQRESRSIRERNASNILVPNIPPQIPLNNLPQIPPNNPPNILGDSQNRNPNFNLRPNNQNHINNPNNPNNPLPTPRNHLKLQKSIHDLMKTQDGLVYVLDASCSIQDRSFLVFIFYIFSYIMS